jgi:hypothetical protein
MPTYLDYQPTAEANTAAAPIGAPEGNYQGRWVNDTFRHMMAAIRHLGDNTPKIPANREGTQAVGSMAYQNRTSVNIEGGRIAGVKGYVPVRAIIDYAGTLTQAAAEQANGWAICDGRTVNGITTPDLRNLFLRAWGDESPGTTGGYSGGWTTGAAGAHTHGGATGSTTLTTAQIPSHTHREGGNLSRPDVKAGTTSAIQNPTGQGFLRPGDYGNQNDSWRWLTEATGGGGGHTHTIGSDGSHTHGTTITPPPYYTVIKLMRVD